MSSFGLRAILLFVGGCLALHAGFLDQESLQAAKEHKLLLVTIESNDCPYCQKMKHEVFNAQKYRSAIDQKFIVVTFQSNDPTLPPDFRPQYLPANAVVSPKNKEVIDAYMGYIEPQPFMEILEAAYRSQTK
jgi:hypothetical protein